MARSNRSLLAATFLLTMSLPVVAQVPKISNRTFTSGTATLKVTGTWTLSEDVEINKPASIADGEMTWLQYGSSGSDSANVLVTVQPEEVGISPAKGKQTATAGADNCKGKLEVTPSLVTGNYKCTGVTSYDQKTRKMGTVDIEISFTARSEP
jgi:hypothetical protein